MQMRYAPATSRNIDSIVLRSKDGAGAETRTQDLNLGGLRSTVELPPHAVDVTETHRTIADKRQSRGSTSLKPIKRTIYIC